MSVLLEWPDVRKPECHGSLHYITLGTRRLALPAVVTLPIKAGIVPYREISHTARINHCNNIDHMQLYYIPSVHFHCKNQ